MSRDEPNPGQHQIIVFDSIQTNIGGAYNNYSGTFTVPISGVYSLTWTIANRCHAMVFTVLVVDNAEVNAIGTDSENVCVNVMATGNVVLDLRAGQVVFIRTVSNNVVKGGIKGNNLTRSTFSGFLIYESEERKKRLYYFY